MNLYDADAIINLSVLNLQLADAVTVDNLGTVGLPPADRRSGRRLNGVSGRGVGRASKHLISFAKQKGHTHVNLKG